MNQLKSLQRINELFSLFVLQVKGAIASGLYDINVVHTSLAQIFDELGNGVTLKGMPVEIDKKNRQSYLTSEQASILLKKALSDYQLALGNLPSRLVIHKSSNYRPDEIEGFRSATEEKGIHAIDFITILDSTLRLFRDGKYPPQRETKIILDTKVSLLYTKGSVPYYQTYAGPYIPQPLEIRLAEHDESPDVIFGEILSLTKMNWNNTRFDGKYPITIGCAREVGKIMKYLGDEYQTRYSFYM